jgi:hypothetical protein
VGYYFSRLKTLEDFKTLKTLKTPEAQDFKMSSRLKTSVGYCPRPQDFKTLKTPQEPSQDRRHARLFKISRLQDSQVFKTPQDASYYSRRFKLKSQDSKPAPRYVRRK